jgi:DNA polymerase I-like protein with 3'-5' exonuclease and polymerase domains
MRQKDAHTQLAADMFGVPYEQVTVVQRDFAKRWNHGVNYGVNFMPVPKLDKDSPDAPKER